MELIKLMYPMRLDAQKAIFERGENFEADGGHIYSVDHFISNIAYSSNASRDVNLVGNKIVDEDNGNVLYEIRTGQWDYDGKFWQY